MQVEDSGTLHVLYLLEHLHDLVDIIAVEGAEITYIKAFEYILLIAYQGLERVVESQDSPLTLISDIALVAEEIIESLAQTVIAERCGELGEVFMERSDVVVDAHLVVIQDDEQVVGMVGGIVETLEGETAADGCVADDGHRLAFLMPGSQLIGDRHSEGCRYGIGGMPRYESVEFRFHGVGEAAETAEGALRLETFAASGQQFVGVGLMADVEHDTVIGGIEHIMQGHNDFHRTHA